LGPRLGAPRQPLLAGWRLERRAPSARRLCEVRKHDRASVGGGQASNLWRIFLDQWRGHLSRTEGFLLHGRCWRSIRADHSNTPTCNRTAWALQGGGGWQGSAEERD